MRLQGVKVLLVEDHGDSLEMFCTVLSHEGAQTDCVSNIAAAVKAAQTLPPDVLVADLSMAGNGVKLVAEVRRVVGRSVPAVCVSAHARPQDQQRAIDAGFQFFLPKPVEPDTLVTVIARTAERGRS